MNVKEIKDIMVTFSKNELTELSVEKEGFSLNLKKEKTIFHQQTFPTQQANFESFPLNQTTAVQTNNDENSVEVDDSDLDIVNSPIIGTFYRASNPEADSYVNIGDNVKVGQVLCIIEAMKIMNEIESEVEGKVVKIYAKNAEAVEFGQKLFAIKAN